MHCRLKDLIWWIPLFLNGTCCNQYWLQYVKSTNQVDMPSTNLGSNADTFKTCYQFLKDFYLLYKEIWNSDFHFEKNLPVFTFNTFKLKNIGIRDFYNSKKFWAIGNRTIRKSYNSKTYLEIQWSKIDQGYRLQTLVNG